jgi:hypothetical protein
MDCFLKIFEVRCVGVFWNGGGFFRDMKPWKGTRHGFLPLTHCPLFGTGNGSTETRVSHRFTVRDGKAHRFAVRDGKAHRFAARDGKAHRFAVRDGKSHRFAVGDGKAHRFAVGLEDVRGRATFSEGHADPE